MAQHLTIILTNNLSEIAQDLMAGVNINTIFGLDDCSLYNSLSLDGQLLLFSNIVLSTVGIVFNTVLSRRAYAYCCLVISLPSSL